MQFMQGKCLYKLLFDSFVGFDESLRGVSQVEERLLILIKWSKSPYCRVSILFNLILCSTNGDWYSRREET